MRAVFRLMRATAPGAFASAALRCTEAEAALWISSNGVRIQVADMADVFATHPGVPYVMSRPGLKVLPTRGVLPPQEILEQTPFYQKFMIPTGWRHAVGLCFWKKGEPPLLDCVMSVNRTVEQGDFSDREIARLGALHAEIELARVRVTAMEERHAALSSFEHFVRGLPLPVALLSWELKPLYHNRLAREASAHWLKGAGARLQNIERDGFETPPALLDAAREMRAEWRARIRVDSQGESVMGRTVEHGGAPGLKATIRLLFLTGSTLGDPNFMIEFEPARTDHKPNFASLLGLTPAERTVVLAAGALKSNGEIAAEIGRSLGTVKSELHSAYKKLGVRTRSELVSLLRAAA